MHILGILGVVVTILVLLNRLAQAGIDIGWLNPFLWHRRRSWRNRHDAHPVHAVSDPLELTALLMLATARSGGDITSEEKTALLASYAQNFHMSHAQAEKLMAASAFLLGDGVELEAKLEAVIGKQLKAFTLEQANSAAELCREVAYAESVPGSAQLRMLARVERTLAPRGAVRQSATLA